MDYFEELVTPWTARRQAMLHGWRRMVAIVSGRPPNLSDEYLARCALELADGVLVQPTMTPSDAVPVSVRRQCFEALFARYFPSEAALLSPRPRAAADPVRSVLHEAIVAKNYGAAAVLLLDSTPVDHRELFARVSEAELGVSVHTPGTAVHVPLIGSMATQRTTPVASVPGRAFAASELAPGPRPEVETILARHGIEKTS
jgi:sulfate adenylyltransferase